MRVGRTWGEPSRVGSPHEFGANGMVPPCKPASGKNRPQSLIAPMPLKHHGVRIVFVERIEIIDKCVVTHR